MKTFSEFIVEATKRVKVLNTKHYTTPENKKEIMNKGFKDSPSSGTYHPKGKSVVYTTPKSRVGNDYGTRPVSLKIVNPKTHSTDSPKNYRSKLKSWMRDASDDDLVKDKNRPTDPRKQAKSAIESGKKIVRVPDAHENPMRKVPKGSYIMVDKDTANKSIDKNPRPTIRATDKPKRTQIAPKTK
jgi:hypothetical protein